MIGSARSTGLRGKRRDSTPGIAPIARAVRIAIAGSATVLALSAPGMVLAAGTCGQAPSSIPLGHQNLAQSDTAAGLAPPVDLTRVSQAELPASVFAASSGISDAGALWCADSTSVAIDPFDGGPVDDLALVDSAGISALASGVHVSDPYSASLVISQPVEETVDSIGDAYAYGATATSYHFSDITVTTDGSVDAVASSLSGSALAVGAYTTSSDTSTLTNDGAITATATSASGDATAYAALVYGTFAGIGLLVNGGDLDAEASVDAGGEAKAIGAYVVANVATIFNDGGSSATATADSGGTAVARGARAYGMYSAISNYGDLTATASAAGGSADARGLDSLGEYGSYAYNASNIQASANAVGGEASAVGSYSAGATFSAYTTNTGSISAQATGDMAVATGVVNASLYIGDAITTNNGGITAVAIGGLAPYGEFEAVATGVYNFAVYYDSIVDNSGSIEATASATADISGTTGFLVAKAIGAEAKDISYGYGAAVVANSGSIGASAMTSQGYAGAWGAIALSGRYGIATIDNDLTISAYAKTDIGEADALGAYVMTVAGTSTILNHGDISASARAERGIVNVTVDYAEATGVRAISLPYGDGQSIVDNYGTIEAHTSILGGIGYANGVQAYGLYTSIDNAAGAHITATVDAELFGGAFATGVEAGGANSVDVVNDGAILAYGHANAYSEGSNGFYGAAGATGISVNASYHGDARVVNNGDVNAIAIAENSVSWVQGGAGATGIYAYAKYGTTIVNAGDVTAIADAQFGVVSAYGVVAHDKYSSSIVNQAGANIVASASVGSLAGDQSAGLAASFGTKSVGSGADYAATYNAGNIISHAVVTPDGTGTPIGSSAVAFGSSIGYNSGILHGALANVGSIEAAASADFGHATAYGAFVRTHDDSAITNAGDIVASASAGGGNAFVVGSYAYSLNRSVTYNCDNYGCDWAHPIVKVDGGSSLIDNSGDIVARANASGGSGDSYGAVALGALTVGITNTGNIVARTDADDALAIGAIANSFYGDAQLQNSGVISAASTGDIASASGVVVHGAHGVQVDNTGTIVAAAYGADATATAVSMESDGSNVLTNTGIIATLGDGTRIAIASGGGATATIVNSGSITGAILAGDLDDSLDNASGGLWHAVGESIFGAGDDHIVNHGTIVMDDAVIDLGGYASGNTFDNFGTLAVSGAANVLDMDNPTPVYNNGVITFVDGAADDRLTIVGDLAGHGALDFDVSAWHEAGDQLYVDGSVVDSSAQTVNVNLVDSPDSANVRIPLVNTSSAVSGSFVLGNVRYAQDGFLAMDFSLIQASRAVSLGVDVTGLNTTGSLAATIAPGVQNLLSAQVGTWRERMGVVQPTRSAGPSPWVRVFSDSGETDPRHGSNFGADGTFDFHQSNHGWELGLDVQPFDHISVGAMIAKSDGSQDIDGAGRDRFDGRTFGLYATWLADSGSYVDVSNRWTGIDVRLRSPTAPYSTEASAQAFNVEAGFRAWTTSFGLNVVPQAQYTRTEVSDIGTLRSAQSAFVNDGGTSSRARIGVAFDKSYQAAGYTWTPYGSLNVLHEFDGDYGHSINGGLLGTLSTGGTSAMLELGLGAHRDRLSVTTGIDWTSGGATRNGIGAQLVLRYGW